ncbi:phosphate transport system permease protein [Desulfovibrio gilichinskyi]|uniref:Phosphate transport system permease protein n=1 Tax=Desulfovibrio gilichinskyi TaxID=1519643 RepID=A0A1X7EM82_9BACT|nr:phosphate transport system permease protein [Desulfovibrio gilichinskyi]
MITSRSICFLLIILAVMSGAYAYKLSSSTDAEQIFISSTEKVAKRGDYSMSSAGALKKVMMLSTHEVAETTESSNLSKAEKEARVDNLNSEINKIYAYVRTDRAFMDKSKDGTNAELLTIIKQSAENMITARGKGWYILSSILGFIGIILFILKALNLSRRSTERLIHSFFLVTAFTSILVLFLIMMFLFIEGLPTFNFVSVKDFIFGFEWYPTDDPAAFGIWPLIVGSGAVTLLSSMIAIPLGVMTAIYLAEIAPAKIRNIVKPAVEMLAALPSVVIGFFGMVVVAPFLQSFFDISVGLNLFNASVMLAFMAVPTITSLSEDALYSVPPELKEASLALGATHWQSIYKVMVPASLSGISTGIILGMARSIGETMVVLMVAGGAGMLPHSIFDPVRPMPASIAAEMGEAPFHSEHYHALFAIGMVLFLFTMVFNLIADYVAHKYKQVGSATL